MSLRVRVDRAARCEAERLLLKGNPKAVGPGDLLLPLGA